MQHPDLVKDARFATRAARNANRDAMLAVFQEFAATFSRFDDFEAALASAGLAVGAVQPLRNVGEDEWARERNALVDVGDEHTGPLRLPNAPFRFSEAEVGTTGRPAWQGEHNREVLRELLGLSEAEIDHLEHDGVLVQRPV